MHKGTFDEEKLVDINGLQYHRPIRAKPQPMKVASTMDKATARFQAPSRFDDADDRQLVRQVSAGDRKAFEVLYCRYSPRLGRFLSRLLRDDDQIGQAINDTMLVVWQKASSFDGRSKLSTWLFGVAYNKALKIIESHSRHNQNVDFAADLDSLPAPESPSRELAERERSEIIKRALASLTPDHRAVVELTFYWGFSYPEIAKIVDCPASTVKTRMFHARKRLATWLSEHGHATGLLNFSELQ